MLDLHQRLQELADAATRDGATPGPAHAIRRGRQRRRRIAAGVASLLLVAVVAGAAGTGQLANRPPLPVAPPGVPSTTGRRSSRRAPGASRGRGPVVGGHQVRRLRSAASGRPPGRA